MKIHNRSIIQFLTIFILWIAGMNICVVAQECNCNETAGEQCFTVVMDADGVFTPLPNPICLSPGFGIGKGYCVLPNTGIILDPPPLGGCGVDGYSETWYTSLPLSNATFLLAFLLIIYGIFIYRKRKQQTN